MDKKIIQQAIRILKNGGVIIYPTDTAYALGGVFNDKKVIRKILRLKKRRNPKFTLIASSLSQVRRFFKLNSEQLRLAKKFWPGPLSIVVSAKYAVRVPDLELARRLARGAGKPLIATSANIAGQKTPYSVDAVLSSGIRPVGQETNRQHLGVDLVLDAGKLKREKISTVVKVEDEKIKVLRAGAVRISPKLKVQS